MVVVVVLAMVFSYGLYRFSTLMVEGLQLLARERPRVIRDLGDLPRVLGAVPSIAFATAMAPLLVTSVSFALATLYLASDLELLLVTPVPMRAVFLARFIEGLLPIYLTLFVLLLPALAGYGLALNYGPGYVVALPLVLLLLPLLPMSLGVLLTMALVRIMPPRRINELMAVLGGLLGVFVYVGTQLLGRSTRYLAPAETAGRLLRLDIPLLPTTWASRLLYASGTGDLTGTLRYGVPYLLATLGLFGLTLAFTERLYYHGWANMAGASGGRVRRRERQRAAEPWLGGPAGAILRKDLRMLPRDLQRLSQLLVPLALSIFWAWQLVSIPGARARSEGVLGSLTATALLVCVLIAGNLGLTGVSREGRGYWLLHLAPINPWPILWAKWTLAFLPFPIVGTFFAAVIGLLRHPPAGELLEAWAIVLMTGVGVSGITTGAGAAYPRFDWTQAQRMTSLRAGCLAPIAYYGYAGLMLLLTLGAEVLARRWGQPVVAAGWTAAALLTVIALLVPLRLAAAKMRRLEL